MNTLKMFVLVLVASLAASDALAQGIDCPVLGKPPVGLVQDRQLAKALFEEGKRLHEAGRYREAMAAFVSSCHTAPDDVKPALIYNVGKATERAGDLANAAAFYRCYLATNPPEGEGRTEAAARLKVIEMGVPAARPQPEPKPTPAPPPHYTKWEDTADARESTQPRRVWTWVAAGFTVAALATGIGFGVSSDRKFQDLDDRGCARTSEGCPRGEVQAIERNQLIANIAFGAAAGGAIATGVLWFWEGRSATVGVKVNPNGASAMIRW